MESGEIMKKKKKKTKRDGCGHGVRRDTCQQMDGKAGIGVYEGGGGWWEKVKWKWAK